MAGAKVQRLKTPAIFVWLDRWFVWVGCGKEDQKPVSSMACSRHFFILAATLNKWNKEA